MQHFRLRCKHCQKEYTYCTYGNGPQYGTEEGCSMYYCAECQKAIDDALSKIPQKCRAYYSFVTNSETKEKLERVFKEEREKFKKSNHINAAKLVGDYGYESVEECTVDWVKYLRGVKKDGTVEFKVEKEYDLINEIETDKLYFDSTNNERQKYTPITQFKLPKLNELEVRPLSPPQGKIFHMGMKI